MAKNKVYIDVHVDDKGTTKRVAVNAKKLGIELDKTSKGAMNADRAMKGASKQSSNSTKNFSKMQQGISGGLVPAYATLAANIFAVSAAFLFLKDAADLRVLKDAQIAFSSATGQGMQSLTADIQEAADGMLNFKDAAQAASIGVASGLGAGQIEALAKGAKNASQVLGRDLTDSFNRLVRGVTKAEPELLDELGITLRLADAQENYAAKLGKSAKSLSNYEKRQAVFNEVQGQLEKKYNDVADAADLEANAMVKLGKAFDSIINTIKEFSAALLEPVASFLADNVTSLAVALGLMAVPIIKQIIPGLENWAQTSRESASIASAAYKSATKDLENLKAAQKIATGDPIAAAQAATVGIKDKGKAFGAIQQGKIPDKRALDALVRSAEKNQGLIMKLEKGNRAVFLQSLYAMQKGTDDFRTKTQKSFRSIGDVGARAAQRVKVAWTGAMSAVSKASALAAKGVDKAFKAIAIIGILLLIKDLALTAAGALGLIKESAALAEFTKEVEDLTGSFETANEEFSKFAQIQAETLEAKGAGKPLLETFKAMAGVLEGTTDNILRLNEVLSTGPDQASVLKSYRDELVKTASVADKMAALEAAGPVRQRTGGMKRAGGGATSAEVAAYKQLMDMKGKDIELTKEQLALLDKTYAKSLDSNLLGGMMQSGPDVEKAKEEMNKFLGILVEGLDATKISATTAGGRLKELAILAQSGPLSGPLSEEFKALSEELREYGSAASFVLQQQDEINTGFSKAMSGITQYTVANSELTKTIKDQIAQIEKAGDFEGKQDKINELNKQKNVLKVIADLELKQTKDKLANEIKFNQLKRGATKLQLEDIAIQQELATIASERERVSESLALATSGEVKADKEQIYLLEQQRDLLDEKRKSIEEANNAMNQLNLGMRNALEGSFESNLADFFKAKKSSFKDMIADIAISTLEAGADAVAKTITKGIFKQEGPAEKIASAMLTGAGIVKEAIIEGFQEGVGKTPSGGSNAADSVIDSAGSAPEKKGFFEYLFGKTQHAKTIVEGTTPSENKEEKSAHRIGGIFSEFTNNVRAIFDKDTPFLKGLGNIFQSGLQGFGSLFGDLFSKLFSGIGGGSGSSLFGTLFSAVAGAFTGGAASVPAAARYGGIVSSGAMNPGYADGGIASGSTAGYPATLHGTEAVVPLPNNRSIPVDLKGAGQQNNVVVNVSMAADGTTSTNMQDKEGQGANMGAMLAKAVQQELQNQKRSGGILNPYGVA